MQTLKNLLVFWLPTFFEWGENNDVMMALYMDFLALGQLESFLYLLAISLL